jgi:hypothetical protein
LGIPEYGKERDKVNMGWICLAGMWGGVMNTPLVGPIEMLKVPDRIF